MKIKLLSAMLIAGTVAVSAQGFKDGVDYFNAGDVEDAKIILDRTLADAATDKAQANYYLGLIALQDGNAAQAEKYFFAGMEANEADPFNYIGLGSVALKAGDAKAAGDQFKKAKDLAKKSKDASVLVEIARAYFNANPVTYSKDIDKYIAEAFKMSKNEEPTVYILQADMVAAEDPGEAAGKYDMAIDLDSEVNHPEAYVKYARTYFKVNPQYAIARLKELLKKQPTSAMAQRELAEKYYDNNQLTMAAEQYGEYIKNPNHFQKDEQRYVGLLYFGKKYNESFDLAQKILAKDPTNIYMQRMEMLNQNAMKNYAEAEKYAERFFSNPAAKGKYITNDYTTYGNILYEQGKFPEALAQYEEALKLSPDKTEIYKDISATYNSMKEPGKALDAYQLYIEKTPTPTVNDKFELASAYESYARSFEPGTPESKENAEKALKLVNEVLEKAPNNATVMRHKGQILFIANGNSFTPEVVEAYQATINVLDQDPANLTKAKGNYVSCYTNLGLAAVEARDMATAKSYFEKALELDPNNANLQNFVDQLK